MTAYNINLMFLGRNRIPDGQPDTASQLPKKSETRACLTRLEV